MRNQIVFIVACIFVSTLWAEHVKQKILIMTPTSNHPEFIEMQHRAFKKFIQDDYEFIVFNDGRDEHSAQEISAMCLLLGISCIRVPQENRTIGKKFSWANYRHGQSIEYMMETVGFNYNGIVVLIDSDLFPIKKFSVANFLHGYDIAGLRQGPCGGITEYMWPGLMFLRMNTLPNKKTMNFLVEEAGKMRLDTGGSMYHYFQANPSVRKRFFKQDGRFQLDENHQPFYFRACPYEWRYGVCKTCLKYKENRFFRSRVAAKRTNALMPCTHLKAFFQERGFRKNVINLITRKQVPHGSEFLLGDTFFHAVAGSGYENKKPKEVREKDALIKRFMHSMLYEKGV